MLRFNSDEGYLAPSGSEVQHRFQQLGFKGAYSMDMVQDLACAYSTYSTLGRLIPKSFDSSEYSIDEKFTIEKAQEYHNNIQSFVAGLNWDLYPGSTPLAKAASVVQAFSKEMERSPSQGEGTSLPFFQQSKDKIKSELENKEEIIQTLDASSEVVNSFLGEGNTCSRLASMNEEQLAVIKNLAILGSRGKIKSRKTTATQTTQQMSEMTQVSRLSNVSSMCLPTFGYKLATKQLVVKQPKQSAKQLLVLAIDASGSMNSADKKAWVKAIILDRLNAVIKGEAKLIICWFENGIYDNISYIETKGQAIEYASNFRVYNSGGITNVANVIQDISERITKRTFKIEGENPQIVIMNDGQDTVNPFCLKYTVNAFILGQDNEGFETLVKSNGGHYERFL